ncbi:hypothetical protein GCM10027452_15850 [Micromonospora halotolerans]
MSTVTVSAFIEAQDVDVWRLLTDLPARADWLSAVGDVEILTSGDLGAGTAWRETRVRPDGVAEPEEFLVVEAVAPARLVLSSRGAGADYRITWTLRTVERRRRGCTEISVASFSFQAPGFYRRHGYTDTGIRDGIPGGHVDHQFWKPLVDDPAGVLRVVALVDLSADPDAGREYEDAVLALLTRHGGRLERRLRTGDGTTEVHVIRFAARAGYDAFLVDPERVALRAALGDAAPTTQVLDVHDV